MAGLAVSERSPATMPSCCSLSFLLCFAIRSWPEKKRRHRPRPAVDVPSALDQLHPAIRRIASHRIAAPSLSSSTTMRFSSLFPLFFGAVLFATTDVLVAHARGVPLRVRAVRTSDGASTWLDLTANRSPSHPLARAVPRQRQPCNRDVYSRNKEHRHCHPNSHLRRYKHDRDRALRDGHLQALSDGTGVPQDLRAPHGTSPCSGSVSHAQQLADARGLPLSRMQTTVTPSATPAATPAPTPTNCFVGEPITTTRCKQCEAEILRAGDCRLPPVFAQM